MTDSDEPIKLTLKNVRTSERLLRHGYARSHRETKSNLLQAGVEYLKRKMAKAEAPTAPTAVDPDEAPTDGISMGSSAFRPAEIVKFTSERKDGGPAFPVSAQFVRNEGMTLRDWFAGEAPPVPDWWMCDVPAPPPGWNEGDGAQKWEDAAIAWQLRRIALWRFAYADAMLAAREVQQ